MKLAGRLIVSALTAIAALVVLLALRQLSTSRALAIWLVLVTGIALVMLVRHSGRGGERRRSRFEAALRGGPATTPMPVDLLRMERELELGIAGAGSAYHRLLPLLRSAAAARLATRHGIELERRPDAARAVLGEDAWELLRPDRPEPADRFDPGVPRSRTTAAIERVESL